MINGGDDQRQRRGWGRQSKSNGEGGKRDISRPLSPTDTTRATTKVRRWSGAARVSRPSVQPRKRSIPMVSCVGPTGGPACRFLWQRQFCVSTLGQDTRDACVSGPTHEVPGNNSRGFENIADSRTRLAPLPAYIEHSLTARSLCLSRSTAMEYERIRKVQVRTLPPASYELLLKIEAFVVLLLKVHSFCVFPLSWFVFVFIMWMLLLDWFVLSP